MSIRSVTDGELKEVFAVVDTDCGGTVSAEEFQKFIDDPLMGTELKPALTSNYKKSANAIGIYDTRSGKGQGLATGEAPWARPESAPGYKLTAAGRKTEEDWNQSSEAYEKLMYSKPPRRDVSTSAAALPTRFFTEGMGGFQRHNSASEMDKVWARQRRKKAHVAEKLTSVAFGGVKHRADGKTLSMHNMADAEAAALFAAYDVDGDGKFTKDELLRMGRVGAAILASDVDGDGEINRAELAKHLDMVAAEKQGRVL